MNLEIKKKFALLSEELEIAKQKILALQNFKTTQAFSVLEAWVPQKDFEKFHQEFTYQTLPPMSEEDIDGINKALIELAEEYSKPENRRWPARRLPQQK